MKVTLVMEDHEAMEGVETENQNGMGREGEINVIMETQEASMMNREPRET